MQKINLRDLYPDIYKTDIFLEVTDEVHAVFLADKRADAAYERQMYRYKAYYSLDHDNGIENAVINRAWKNTRTQGYPRRKSNNSFAKKKYRQRPNTQ